MDESPLTYLHTYVPITLAYNNISDECQRHKQDRREAAYSKSPLATLSFIVHLVSSNDYRQHSIQESLSSPFAHSIITADPQRRRLPENPEVQRIRRETACSMGFSLSKVNNSVRSLSVDEVK